MAKRVRVEMNDAGVRELLKSDEVRSFVEGIGQRVLDTAVASAPVDTGSYRDSARMWTDYSDQRVRVHVGFDDDAANLVEAKTGNLARALDSAGG